MVNLIGSNETERVQNYSLCISAELSIACVSQSELLINPHCTISALMFKSLHYNVSSEVAFVGFKALKDLPRDQILKTALV